MGTRTIFLSCCIMGAVLLLASERRRTGEIRIHRYLLMSLALLPCLFFLKLHSSLGRIHIWKISFSLLTEQCVFKGLGHGNFNTAYNHHQAAYFWGKSLLNKSAMLANDGYYAFNEFMHFGIEYGWYAGVLLLMAFVAFVWQNVRMIYSSKAFHNIEFVATLLLWPIAIGCWFGYPLHMAYGPVYVTFLMVIILVSSIIQGSRARLLVFSMVFISFVAIGGYIRHLQIVERKLIYQSQELWQLGAKQEALQNLNKFCANNPTAIPHVEILANWHWLLGKEQQAIHILEKHHQYHCNQRIHETLGQWYAVTGNFEKASIHLHTSLYITPHLLRSRALLADFYFLNSNIDSARYWAEAVVTYPPKIAHQPANELKQSASFWLLQSIPVNSPFQLLN